jgi:type IV pilus assembly protein PilE
MRNGGLAAVEVSIFSIRRAGFVLKGARGGFSLLELLVVVAVTAILLSLAIPSYRQYVQRGYRAEAVSALLSIAACQERVRSGGGYFDTTRCLDGVDSEHYEFRLEPAGQTASMEFTASARPRYREDGQPCGTLSIDQAGSTHAEGDPAQSADCWSGR